MRFSIRQQTGRGKKQRTLCPACKENYLRATYIQKQTGKTRAHQWIKIGLFCDKCRHFQALEA